MHAALDARSHGRVRRTFRNSMRLFGHRFDDFGYFEFGVWTRRDILSLSEFLEEEEPERPS